MGAKHVYASYSHAPNSIFVCAVFFASNQPPPFNECNVQEMNFQVRQAEFFKNAREISQAS
jgi:hypothetical protein